MMKHGLTKILISIIVLLALISMNTKKEPVYDDKIIYYTFPKTVVKAIDSIMKNKDCDRYFLMLEEKDSSHKIYFWFTSELKEENSCSDLFENHLLSSNRKIKVKCGELPIAFWYDFSFANHCSRSITGSFLYIDFNKWTGKINKIN
jgi:hypothetical protein